MTALWITGLPTPDSRRSLRQASYPQQLHHVLGHDHPCRSGQSQHPQEERGLAEKRHSKVHFHFTPTSSSRLNQVETWFSILQGQSLTGASFTALKQLHEHIDAFIAAYNENAKPFAWKKKRVYQRRFKGRRITKL